MTALLEFESHSDPFYRRWFYMGALTIFVAPWWIGTTVGVLAGGEIGEGWQLPFAVPVTFIALLVPSVRSRPMVIAAMVGGFVAVASHSLPSGLNIIAGAFSGIAAGVVATPEPELDGKVAS